MRSISSLRTASAVVGMFGLMAVGLAQTVPTPDWTADSANLSGHATGPVLDTRITSNGNTVASIAPNAGNPGGNEIRVRQAGNGAFLWTANVGDMPPLGLAKIGFSNDSANVYFASRDAGGVRRIEIRNALTGANAGGGPIALISPSGLVNRFAFSPNGTFYAYQDSSVRTGGTQHQVVIRNVSGNGVVATVGFGSGGTFPGIRDFIFTPDSTEILVALTDGRLMRVNYNSGVETVISPTLGNETNRIVPIPGITTTFLLARASGAGALLQRRNYSDGALVTSYSNVPAGAVNNAIIQEFDTTTSEPYMVGVVGAFDFMTYVRLSNGDPVASYDLRRTGEPSSDSRMTSLAANSSAFFSGATNAAAPRVLAIPRPIYNVAMNIGAVVGGNSIQGTVTLPGPAPAGGFLVGLADDNPNATTPASVTVPAGASSANFTVTTVNLEANETVNITATFPNGTRSTSFTIVRVQISSLTVNRDPAVNSSPVIGTVTLNTVTSTDRVIPIIYNTPVAGYTTAPTSVTVPAGSASGNFTFVAKRVEVDTAGSLSTGTMNGTSASRNITIVRSLVQGTDFYPYIITPGMRYYGVVRLARTVATDTSVAITTTRPTAFPNRTVVVPAGSKYAAFSAVAGTATSFGVVSVTSTGPEGELRSNVVYNQGGSGNTFGAGRNSNRELADGSVVSRHNAVPAQGITSTIRKSVASQTTVMHLLANGTVWVSGLGNFGELGNGTSGAGAVAAVPQAVPGLTNVVDIFAGRWHLYALRSNGELYGWGRNIVGSIGDGTAVQRTTPVLLGAGTFGTNVVSVAAGQFHTLFLDNTGQIWACGSTTNGRLGIGVVPAGQRNTPVLVPAVPNTGQWVHIAAGYDSSYAINANGQTFVWGLNASGQLADGTNVDKASPTALAAANVRQIAAGLGHVLMMTTLPYNGPTAVFASGLNADGQLGLGNLINRNTLAQVPGTGVVQVAAGEIHSAYLNGSGVASAWGDGSTGQNAWGQLVDRSSPTVIWGPNGLSTIALGSRYSVFNTRAGLVARSQMLFWNPATGVLRSYNTVPGTFTAITGAVTSGRTVVAGGTIRNDGTGSTTPFTGVLSFDSVTRELWSAPVVSNAYGTETMLGTPLGATEEPKFLADSNNDTIADLYTVDTATRQIAVRNWNGSAFTSTDNLYIHAPNEQFVGVGDFNGDRRPDLVIFNTTFRTVNFRFFAGTTSLGTVQLQQAGAPLNFGALPVGYAFAGGGEIQAPGNLDIVFQDTATSQMRWYDLSRTNTLVPDIAGATPPSGFVPAGGFWR